MTDRVDWWVELFAHWTLSWTAVVLFVGTGIVFRRPSRSTVRYAGWSLATFAGAILLPIFFRVVPTFSLRDALSRQQTAPNASPGDAKSEPFHSWFENMIGSASPQSIATATRSHSVPQSSVSADLGKGLARPATPLSTCSDGDAWIVVALSIWMAGSVLFLVRLARAAWLVRALAKGFTAPSDGELAVEAEAIRRALNVRRRVRIMVHPGVAAPMCIGLIRPVVVLPAHANCPMTGEQRRAALVHEFAHLRHLDDWVALTAEVWRALAWFFLPVHWTVARMRLERECRCDDLAAGEMRQPETYARWLLDLAPIQIDSPLAASLSARSTLAERVRRIIRGELTWRRPLRRRHLAAIVMLGIVLLATCGSVRLITLVRADEPIDAPLPDITPKDLASRIRTAWVGYDRGLLEITFDTTTNTNWRFMTNQGKAADQQPIIVQFPGRARFLGSGERWRIEYDSMTATSLSRKTNPHRWSSGFDGRQLYGWDIMGNVVTLGEAELGADRWRPVHQFWHNGTSLVEALEERVNKGDSLNISQRIVDGSRCYVVDRFYAKPGIRTEEVISPRQGFLIIRTTSSLKDKPFHLHSLHDVHKVESGAWAPGRIVEESRTVRNDGQKQLRYRTESHIITFKPNKSFGPEAFTFDPPYGVDVTDRRLGYSYHNDPWWPEAGALLRERFDWPNADRTPLRDVGTVADFEGRNAPPVSASAWVNSKPRQLSDLRGKVVLIEFWDPSCWLCRQKIAALRTLYQTYHPLGLEMISIQTPTDNVEDVRRFAREFRIPYPIAVDTHGKEGGVGVTALAYGVKDHPCAFLVDRVGEVHSVGKPTQEAGRLTSLLVQLLKDAGAKDVPAWSEDRARLSPEMEQAVSEALRTWIGTSPASGEIRGRVVDGQGRPIVGAQVSARLTLTLLIFASPGGYQLIPQRGRFEATTGTDGRFVVPGLTRGMYTVRVEAPELAWRERSVPIGPNAQSVDVELALDQGGEITGVVRDSDGKPIGGATVDPTKWHHRTQSGAEVFTSPSGARAVQTNADGLYLLPSLQHGGYTLEFTAPGFDRSTLEAIPAGTPNADARLDRAKP